MKKSELKNMIKECVREVLFEEGVLSDVIAEVTHGLVTAQGLLTESSQAQEKVNHRENKKQHSQALEVQRKQLQETKKKMLSAIGSAPMSGVFEGTEPLAESSTHSPLSGMDANDAGVDISGFVGLSNGIWEKLK